MARTKKIEDNGEEMLSLQDIIRNAIESRASTHEVSAKKTLHDFAEYVFKDPKGNPIELQPFHHEMLDMMTDYKKVLILAPRGSGKSSLSSVVYSCFRIMKSRDVRIIIVSNTIDLAKEWLREIARIMSTNEEYRRLAGDDMVPATGELTWTDTEKVIKGRSPYATHVTLKAVGVKGSLLGKRADIIICDDLLDPDNSGTPHQRELVSNWFHQVLIPILEPDGQVIVIGTRFARGDLYEELWDTWTKKKPDGTPVFPDAKVIKVVAEPEPGVSYWPSRFPYEVLEAKKLTNSLAWWSQYMNEPIDLTGSFLRREWLQNYYENLPDYPTYYVGMDPSISGKGDSTGIVVVATCPKDHHIYIVDAFREKADLASQKLLLDMVCRLYNPALVNVEANAAQQIITQYLQTNTFLPIRESQTRYDKPTRMANMAAHFNAGRVKMRAQRDPDSGKLELHPSLKVIEEEWVGFRPKDANDDILDAMEKAIEVVAITGEAAMGSLDPPTRGQIDTLLGKRRTFRLFR